MPFFESTELGRLEYQEEETILFPAGLPGFENARRFLVVMRAAAAPLVFLQSLEDAGLCFVCAPLERIAPGYEPAVVEEDLAALGWPSRRPPALGADLAGLAILAAGEDGRLTANLLAPVLIHVAERRAVQAVRPDRRYSHAMALGAHPDWRAAPCW